MSDFNTPSTSYPDSNTAHREEFLEWIGGQMESPLKALRRMLADGASIEGLASECVDDGWFERRDWFDHVALLAAVEQLAAEARA